jgi:hypothetical protein
VDTDFSERNVLGTQLALARCKRRCELPGTAKTRAPRLLGCFGNRYVYEAELPTVHEGSRPRSKTVESVPMNAWLTESELCDHDTMGRASAFGVPVDRFSLQFWSIRRARFASDLPPLVLYHGTGLSAVAGIAFAGTLLAGTASDDSMMGPGVYAARWDRAVEFSRHDAYNVPRAVPGVVVRVIVLADTVVTRRAQDICSCGCARPYVDHGARATAAADVVCVPSGARGATRFAEWCIRSSAAIVLDGMYRCC